MLHKSNATIENQQNEAMATNFYQILKRGKKSEHNVKNR
jgi:hypothetical protein